MKCVAVVAALVAIATAAPMFSDVVEEIEFAQEEATPSLGSAVSFLQNVAPNVVKYHVARVAKHVALLQSKPKVHDHLKSQKWIESKAAIKAALKSLTDELDNGNVHDNKILSDEKTRLNSSTSTARANAKNSVQEDRSKVCPQKRAEEVAEAKESAALTKLSNTKSGKVCDPELDATWSDMNVEKVEPTLAPALSTAWQNARKRYLQAKDEHDTAAKEALTAKQNRETAMTTFKEALNLQTTNAETTCKNAASEFTTLCNEVQSNVRTRKQTYIASLVITCFIDHLTSNSDAKKCADEARGANTGKFDISCGATETCPGAAHWRNQNSWGPSSWEPTPSACHLVNNCAVPAMTVPAGYKYASCGDCTGSGQWQLKNVNSVAKCAEECNKSAGCKSFSYGVKRIDGTNGLGCRISKAQAPNGKCINTVAIFCSTSYNDWHLWKGAGHISNPKSCCSTTCGKINYYGGIMYDKQ